MLLAGFVLHVNKSYELLRALHSRNSNPHSHFAQSAACSLGFVSLKKKSHFPRAEWDFFSETDLFTKKKRSSDDDLFLMLHVLISFQ